MFIFAFSEETDIHRMPTSHEHLNSQPGSVIVTGDAHGNVINVLHKMIRHGVIYGISEKEYSEMVSLYLMDINRFTRADFLRFEAILAKARYRTTALVVVEGDDLGDRGFKDPLMLRLVAHMRQNGVPLIILISNHTIEALECLEKAAINEASGGAFIEQVEFTAPRLTFNDSRSLNDIETMIRNRVVTQAELVKWYVEDYRPALRLMHCVLTPNNQCIVLTHAPAGLDTIQGVARHPLIAQNYDDSTPQMLVGTVERINREFMKLAEQNRIRELYQGKIIERAYTDPRCLLEAFPIETLMCNRMPGRLMRPAEHRGYQLAYIHGHCKLDYNEAHFWNTNSALGQADNHQGLHLVLYISSIAMPHLTLYAIENRAPIRGLSIIQTFEMHSEGNDSSEEEKKLSDDETDVGDLNAATAPVIATASSVDVKQIPVRGFRDLRRLPKKPALSPRTLSSASGSPKSSCSQPQNFPIIEGEIPTGGFAIVVYDGDVDSPSSPCQKERQKAAVSAPCRPRRESIRQTNLEFFPDVQPQTSHAENSVHMPSKPGSPTITSPLRPGK